MFLQAAILDRMQKPPLTFTDVCFAETDTLVTRHLAQELPKTYKAKDSPCDSSHCVIIIIIIIIIITTIIIVTLSSLLLQRNPRLAVVA